MSFLADLFKNTGNRGWDLARILSTISLFAVMILAAYEVHSGQNPGLRDFSGSLMDVLIGSGLIISAKEGATAYAASKLSGS